jgi:hypothetical protein
VPDENFNWKVRLGIAKEREALREATSSPARWLRSWNIRFASSAAAALLVVSAAGYFVLTSTLTPQRDVGPDITMRSQDATVADPESPAAGDRAPETEKRVSSMVPGPVLGMGNGVMAVSDGGAIPTDGVRRQPFEEDRGPTVFDPDSLVRFYIKSASTAQRMQLLERQIESLQSYLRQCESQAGKTSQDEGE